MTPFERLTAWLAAAPAGCWRTATIDGPDGGDEPWYEVILNEVSTHSLKDDAVAEGESLDAVLTQALDAMDKILASYNTTE